MVPRQIGETLRPVLPSLRDSMTSRSSPLAQILPHDTASGAAVVATGQISLGRGWLTAAMPHDGRRGGGRQVSARIAAGAAGDRSQAAARALAAAGSDPDAGAHGSMR